ncbi:unnamed protein product [Rotaria sp. Silwood2]|nr:unnamed protein product [Rotaria sp. Silwood2]
MDSTNDAPYALDYSESMAFFNSAYNPTSAQSITATEFDIAQELLWAGSNEFLDMDSTNDAPYALDYSESMAFFNSAYNPTSAQSITATEFDIAQELLWAGSNEV